MQTRRSISILQLRFAHSWVVTAAFFSAAAAAVLRTSAITGGPLHADESGNARRLVAPFSERAAAAARAAWVQRLSIRPSITNSIGMKLLLIPPGDFVMGSIDRSIEVRNTHFPQYRESKVFSTEEPAHPVHLTRPYYIGVHEVTVSQFGKFLAATKYRTGAEADGKGGVGYHADAGGRLAFEQAAEYSWSNPGFLQEQSHPVVNVTWNDAVEFCRWLSKTEGRRYRLPTEAEWEYACRAGSAKLYYHGDDPVRLTKYENVLDLTGFKELGVFGVDEDDGYAFTAPVGTFSANVFGLHDMLGNVSEWCEDRFNAQYYAESPTEDPAGAAEGSMRVARGGSWCSYAACARSAHRAGYAQGHRDVVLGFRIAMEP